MKRLFLLFAAIGLVGIALAVPAVAKLKHEFHNKTFEMVDHTGGTAKGSYHIICNAGMDVDEVRFKATGLKPNTTYKFYYVNHRSQKREAVGTPSESTTDENGTLRYVVFGHLCPFERYQQFIVVEQALTVLSADVTLP